MSDLHAQARAVLLILAWIMIKLLKHCWYLRMICSRCFRVIDEDLGSLKDGLHHYIILVYHGSVALSRDLLGQIEDITVTEECGL